MKDTASFTTMVEEASEPITVTKNGREAFVVMKPEDYEAMQEEVAKSQLLSRLMLAEEELAAGDCFDYGKAVAEVRARHGIDARLPSQRPQ